MAKGFELAKGRKCLHLDWRAKELPCNSKLNLAQTPALKGLQFQAYSSEFLGINDKIPQVGGRRIHLHTPQPPSEGLGSFQREESECLGFFPNQCCIWNMKEANKFGFN